MNRENDSFSFIWKVENWRMVSETKWDFIDSPKFQFENVWNSTWFLRLYPFGGDENGEVSCYLCYDKISNGPDTMIITFDIICIADPFIKYINKSMESCKFTKGSTSGYKNFECSSAFENKDNFDKNDIYIVCYVENNENELKFNNKIEEDKSQNTKESLTSPLANLNISLEPECAILPSKMKSVSNTRFARTTVLTEKKSFMWLAEDILKTKFTEHIIITVKFTTIPNLFVIINKSKENILAIEIQTIDKLFTCFQVTCKIWIFDLKKDIGCFDVFRHQFNADKDKWNFEYEFNVDDLRKKNSFVNYEIEISDYDGNCWTGDTPQFDVPIQDLINEFQPAGKLEYKMNNLYENKLFCDATIRLQSKDFPVHKAILCEASPVFKAMFENQMQEAETNVVVMEDIDDSTLNQMLKFIYCESVEDLEFESALKLYKAADRYQFSILRLECVTSILENLSLENVFSVLTIADTHFDKKMFSCAVQYLFPHIRDILFTKDWDTFSRNHLEIAKKILQELCIKFLDKESN